MAGVVQKRRVNIPGALRDAALTGLIAFGVFLPLIGFQTTVNGRNELILVTRWPFLVVLVAIIVAGRFAYSVVAEPWLAQRAMRPVKPTTSPWRAQVAKWFVPFAIGFVLVYPPLVIIINGFGGALKWIDNFGIQILIYVMLGWGLNIVVGLAGLLDLGYVAFYAVGAYSYALLAKTFGFAFWLLLPLSGILASFWGILLGFPVLRLRGDYLAIVTLAFGEIIRLILINWVDLTNGYAGISGIPRPSFFGIPFTADDNGFAAVFGLEFSPTLSHHLPLLRDPGAGACSPPLLPSGCAGCRSAAPGRRCARTKSPAARSASTPPTPSSPPSPWAPCLQVSPARSSLRGRVSFLRNPSPSWNPQQSCRSSCSAAWVARSASPSPPS